MIEPAYHIILVLILLFCAAMAGFVCWAMSDLNKMSLQMRNEEALLDKIDEWHNSKSELPLHEYMGMTWEEYADWVRRPSID